MIVDSSVLVAILMEEPEMKRLEGALVNTESCRISAVSFVEASMVMVGRKGVMAPHMMDTLLARAGVQIVPFTETQARLARQAFLRYGKGRHAAQLNFGDCMAYALAVESGEELLFKGTDFSQTDVAVATY